MTPVLQTPAAKLSLVLWTSTLNLAVAQPAVRLGLPKPLVTTAALGASVGVTVTVLEFVLGNAPANCEVPETLTVSVTVASAGSPYLCAVKVHDESDEGGLVPAIVTAEQDEPSTTPMDPAAHVPTPPVP